MKEFKVFDMHCDTIYKLMNNPKSELLDNEFSVSINKMIQGNYMAQFFALFVDKSENPNLYERGVGLLDRFKEEVSKNSDKISIVKSLKEIEENERNNKLSAILSIEEGGVLEGDINKLKQFYDEGVRLVTLTWNYINELGYPNAGLKYRDKGLTKTGKEFVEAMNEWGMIIDVSHLSDAGFYDVCNLSKKPFVATHSNARAVTNHPRNLTDDMIVKLANAGGVTGMNYCGAFMGDHKYCSMEHILNHIKYIRNKGGIDILALGSDFDGIENEVEMKDASEMQKLAHLLSKNGFTDDDIEKIYYKNMMRVLKDTIK